MTRHWRRGAIIREREMEKSGGRSKLLKVSMSLDESKNGRLKDRTDRARRRWWECVCRLEWMMITDEEFDRPSLDQLNEFNACQTARPMKMLRLPSGEEVSLDEEAASWELSEISLKPNLEKKSTRSRSLSSMRQWTPLLPVQRKKKVSEWLCVSEWMKYRQTYR